MELSAVGARLSALIVVIVVTAGCGGDPPTPPPFTPSSAASSPTSTAPEEPVLPEAAKEPTAAGAKAFAEFYWNDISGYAQATGDTKLLRRLSAVTCGPCDGGADAIEDIYGRGGVLRGGMSTVTNLKTYRIADATPRFRVTFRTSTKGQEVDFPGTKNDSTFTPATKSADMHIDFLHGGWLVAGWILR